MKCPFNRWSRLQNSRFFSTSSPGLFHFLRGKPWGRGWIFFSKPKSLSLPSLSVFSLDPDLLTSRAHLNIRKNWGCFCSLLLIWSIGEVGGKGWYFPFLSVWWPLFLVDSNFLELLISYQQRTIEQTTRYLSPRAPAVSDACPKFVSD